MTILLADLLDDLREDHRNMAILLDLLERQIEQIRDGERPDYELIQDIMRYMTVYSDSVHHPKEDLLYAAMKAEKPDLDVELERIGPEHREIKRLGEALRNDVEAIVSGAAVTRAQVVVDTTNYVQKLRQHMAWEEEDLFRRSSEMVQREKSMFVDISHLDTLDPVFGPEREHSFANLLQYIKDFSEVPGELGEYSKVD
jgi:hemerythrin-like domain-containing protein